MDECKHEYIEASFILNNKTREEGLLYQDILVICKKCNKELKLPKEELISFMAKAFVPQRNSLPPKEDKK